MRKLAVVVTSILAMPSAMAQLSDRDLDDQLKIENVCARKSVQSVLIHTYNNADALTKTTGKIASMRDMSTYMVDARGGILSCRGEYHFVNGTSKRMTFSFSYIFHTE